jgi:hypothetical protein
MDLQIVFGGFLKIVWYLTLFGYRFKVFMLKLENTCEDSSP